MLKFLQKKFCRPDSRELLADPLERGCASKAEVRLARDFDFLKLAARFLVTLNVSEFLTTRSVIWMSYSGKSGHRIV